MKETTRKSVPRSAKSSRMSLANTLDPPSYSAHHSDLYILILVLMSRTAFGRPVLWLQRVYSYTIISSARPVTKD